MVNATAPEENNHRTPTVPGHQLEDLLREATVRAASAEAAVAPVVVTAAAGAHHTVLVGELEAVAIAEAEATQTTMSPASHTAATMPAAEFKKYVAKGL
jgi:predicted phage gp36 major capsid-like protein